jgi:uncharacterized protein
MATMWLSKAATQGDVIAENALGIMYLNGQGVIADESLAAAWFLKAAEQGHQGAQANLCYLYQTGRGVSRDIGTAYMWCLLSVRGSSAARGQKLRELASAMSKTDIDKAEREASEWLTTHKSSQEQSGINPALRVY